MRLVRLLLLSLALLPTAARAEETVLLFRRATRVMSPSPMARDSFRLDTASARITVCLGDHRLIVYEPSQVRIFDFTRRRLIQVSAESRSYSDRSLYGMVAFNEMEMASRLDAPSDRRPASVLETEALFSMGAARARLPGESLVDSSSAGRVRIRMNGRVTTLGEASRTVLLPRRAVMLERFLIYQCHLHPIARQALMRTGRVPQWLSYRYVDGDREVAELLTLERVTSAPESSDPARGMTRMDVTERALRTLEDRLRQADTHCADTAVTRWAEGSRNLEKRALAEKRYLDARLASEERASTVCETPSWRSWPPETRRLAEADSAFARYHAAFGWTDSTSAHAAVESLKGLDTSQLTRAHMLDLAAARARFAAHDVRGGMSYLVDLLGRNPCAVQAWVELGDAFRREYQTVLAWFCYDAARAAAPQGCGLTAEVDRLERDLAARHPEYFE